MLTQLSIRDVVTIDRLDLAFAAGLCVLTGETGAGKSIVLDALGLALGGRADAALIRTGADKLSVSAVFALSRKHPVLGLLQEHDLPVEDDGIVLRRTLGADGRSRAFVNDQPVSVGLLRSLGAQLIEVHGQFETHGLLDPGTHIDALDAYRTATAGDDADRVTRTAWAAWRAAGGRAQKPPRTPCAAALSEEETLRHHAGRTGPPQSPAAGGAGPQRHPRAPAPRRSHYQSPDRSPGGGGGVRRRGRRAAHGVVPHHPGGGPGGRPARRPDPGLRAGRHRGRRSGARTRPRRP